VAHSRTRHLLKQLLKRKSLWPILGVLGARQTGKSTLLRDQLAPKLAAHYITLDRHENLEEANRAPGLFLSTHGDAKYPLIIDEVQKAPVLFDSLKANVDEHRRPGRYYISGSTEFSKRTGIRESLTGRIGLTHLYPFTIGELYERGSIFPWIKLAPSRTTLTEVKLWLDRGGMPGACFLRSEEERNAYFESYLDTICFRDLPQIQGAKLSGKLALEILFALAVLSRPTLSEITSRIRVDSRKIKLHLEALAALFIIHPLSPHPRGVGKERYLIFDAGIAAFLNAPLSRRLEIFCLNECLAQHEYSGLGRPRLYYYESAKHSHLDLIIERRNQTIALALSEDESPGAYYEKTVRAFLKRIPKAKVFVLAPVKFQHEAANYQIVPWSYFS